jgi:hypothetical protein
VTRRFHQKQKHKFGVTFPGALFMETTPGPPEHAKYCVDVLGPLEHEKVCVNISHRGCTRMHYVTHKSQRMYKHRFSVMCPDALSVESVPLRPE